MVSPLRRDRPREPTTMAPERQACRATPQGAAVRFRRARPQGVQGVRRPRPLRAGARRRGRLRDRPRLRRGVPAAPDRRRPRHARVVPVHGPGGHRGRRRRRGRRPRPRDDRDGDALLRRRRARARGRPHRHRIAQPEGVHGDEDRPRGRAPRRRRLGPCGGARPGRARLRRFPGAGRRPRGGHLAGVPRQGPLLHRRRRGPAAAGRHRRGQRDGRGDAAARARAAADRCRPLLLRAGRHLPEPRAEPALPGEPRVHRREDARGGRRPRRRFRRRRRPLLLRRRLGRVRPGRLRHRAARGADAREGAGARRSSTTSARAGPCPTPSASGAASRW